MQAKRRHLELRSRADLLGEMATIEHRRYLSDASFEKMRALRAVLVYLDTGRERRAA